MAEPNRTEFALLGMLAQGPKSGYDINKLVEERLSHFWNESLGHIYPVLKRLHRRGWVERNIEISEGSPPRHEYAITGEGRVALRDWFREPPRPVPPRNELLLKMFLGKLAPPGALVEQVAGYRQRRQQDLETLSDLAERLSEEMADDPEYPYWNMTLSAGIHAARAAVDWCDEVMPDLGDRSPTPEMDNES